MTLAQALERLVTKDGASQEINSCDDEILSVYQYIILFCPWVQTIIIFILFL